MKRESNLRIHSLLVLVLLSIVLTGCPLPVDHEPTVATADVSSITAATAISGGTVTADGGADVTARGVCWNTATGPIVTNSKTSEGTGTGTFSSTISGLNPGVKYYVRAYATNSAGTGYGSEVSFTTNSSTGTVTDIDGNVYKYVTIGTQVWMAENLKVTKYSNGAAIPNVTDALTWSNLSTGAYCDWGNSLSNGVVYGHLYNYFTVTDSRQVCPVGWHAPSNTEWATLSTYLGGEYLANFKLREAGTLHWPGPATSTNETGFTALPGGCRDSNGVFADFGGIGSYVYYGFWWSTTDYPAIPGFARIRQIYCETCAQRATEYSKKYGLSVRCLKD